MSKIFYILCMFLLVAIRAEVHGCKALNDLDYVVVSLGKQKQPSDLSASDMRKRRCLKDRKGRILGVLTSTSDVNQRRVRSYSGKLVEVSVKSCNPQVKKIPLIHMDGDQLIVDKTSNKKLKCYSLSRTVMDYGSYAVTTGLDFSLRSVYDLGSDLYYKGKEKIWGDSDSDDDDDSPESKLAELREGRRTLFESYNSQEYSHMYLQLCFTTQSVIEYGNRLTNSFETCDDCHFVYVSYEQSLEDLLNGKMPEVFNDSEDLSDPVHVQLPGKGDRQSYRAWYKRAQAAAKVNGSAVHECHFDILLGGDIEPNPGPSGDEDSTGI